MDFNGFRGNQGWRPLHDPELMLSGCCEPTRLSYEDLRTQGFEPRCDCEADEMERQLAELFGEEPVVMGHVELRQIRRKWHLIVRFKVARGTDTDDPELAAMMKVLRSRLLRCAAITVRTGILTMEVPTPPALDVLEYLRESDELTVEARRPVHARLAHAWADTRSVRATLLGAGGVGGSPVDTRRVLNDLETRSTT